MSGTRSVYFLYVAGSVILERAIQYAAMAKVADYRTVVRVKKSGSTAETAETAEKNLRYLSDLRALCGKTSCFFTGSNARHYV